MSIPLQSLQQIVLMIDHLKIAIWSAEEGTQREKDVLDNFFRGIHEIVLLTNMTEGQTAVFAHGGVALLAVDSPVNDSAICGYKMWYRRCGYDICCAAPGKRNFTFLTEPAEEISNNTTEIHTFKPLEGRAFIVILFIQMELGCALSSFVTRMITETDEITEKPWVTEYMTPSNDTYDTYDDDETIKEDLHNGEVIDQNVQQVLDDLEWLLLNETVSFAADDVHQAFDQVDLLLEDEGDVEIPNDLLLMLDELGSRVVLKDGLTGTAVRDNVALMIADSRPDNPVRGVRLATGTNGLFQNETFEFVTDADGRNSLQSNETDAMMLLPASVTDSSRRISFVVFRNGRAFHNFDDCVVNSHVLSVNVENFTSFAPGEVVEIQFSPFTKKIRRNESRVCAYWDFGTNGTGFWSQSGCTFIAATQNGALDTCRCDHLTHFAQIIISKDVFSVSHENALQMISVVGNSFSLFGIIIVALTAIVFKSWRRNESNKVWLNLCGAVFVLDVCFLVTVFAKFHQNDIGCILLGMSLHYAVLTTFFWMLVVSILSYRKLVLVFTKDIYKKLWFASAFSWGLPLVVIGLLMIVDSEAYLKEFEEKAPSASFCYPSGLALWLTVFGPIFIIWFVNWILYLKITYKMYTDRGIRRHSGINETLRNASVSCLLAFLCGVPWVFGFFAFNIVAAYLFTLTISFQGFVLFIFFVLGTRNTRNLWKNLFRYGVTGKVPVSFADSTGKKTSSTNSRLYVPKPLPSRDEASGELLSESRL